MNVPGLIDIVANQKQHPRRSLAIQILKYVEQERASFEDKYAGYGSVEFRQQLGEMMLGSDIELIWRSLRSLVTVKGKDGVERLALSKERKPEESDANHDELCDSSALAR